MINDSKGRIIQIEKDDNIHSGHSVCNKCGRDMPGCWDVICNSCKKTFCYECSIVVGGYWLCKDLCRKKLKNNKFKFIGQL